MDRSYDRKGGEIRMEANKDTLYILFFLGRWTGAGPIIAMVWLSGWLWRMVGMVRDGMDGLFGFPYVEISTH